VIVALTGGTGGAKLIEGLAAELDANELTVVCNTGDDTVSHGLHVSPDIDTILYTLGGLIDRQKGWGIAGESFVVLDQLRRLGHDGWFNLGDKDLATHITRTMMLREGKTLTEVTDHLRWLFGVKATILPMSNERTETRVTTPAGEISFQEFFVKQRWQPDVLSVRFAGAERSQPAPGVVEAIRRARAIVICPSNPITSIGPIAAVPGIHAALCESQAPIIGVSPLIGNAPISGPADKLLRAGGFAASAVGVADCYRDFLKTIVIASEDETQRGEIESRGIAMVTTDIRMTDLAAKRRLAREVLAALEK
jgi:LPPG:FO 2-phospho-L-lactate transferase